jgi:uncharacterized membrane protein
MKKIMILLPLLAILLLAGCITGNTTASAPTDQPTAPDQPTPTPPASDSISIPLAQVSSQAKWFEYETSGKTIKFFVVKASDGSIKTAFDACDVCFSSRKGYSQDGDIMVCNNCGNRYPIDGLGTENKAGGGCWPGYLPSQVVGDNVVIKKADLEAGSYRF